MTEAKRNSTPLGNEYQRRVRRVRVSQGSQAVSNEVQDMLWLEATQVVGNQVYSENAVRSIVGKLGFKSDELPLVE